VPSQPEPEADTHRHHGDSENASAHWQAAEPEREWPTFRRLARPGPTSQHEATVVTVPVRSTCDIRVKLELAAVLLCGDTKILSGGHAASSSDSDAASAGSLNPLEGSRFGLGEPLGMKPAAGLVKLGARRPASECLLGDRPLLPTRYSLFSLHELTFK
jgi:hypothetical protein